MRPAASRPTKSRAPKPGRPPGTFTQHRRLSRLMEALEKKPNGLTIEELAGSLKMSSRSVRRYLRELDGGERGSKVAFLESVETTKGGPLLWRIKPGERGRALPLRRAQAYALLATRHGLEPFRGSALYDEADLALAQIAKIAQTPFRASGKTEISGERQLEDRFLVVPGTARNYAARGEDLDELFRAVADLRVLRYRPRPRAGAPRAERVSFHPYALVVHEGAILVVGVHPSPARGAAREEVEVLLLDRMTDVRTSETEHFELPADFEVAQYVHGELGVAPPSRARFLVEFDVRAADEVKARRFHPQQRLATSPDGRVRLSLPLVDPRAAVAFVLSWGDAAKVIEPPELARELRTIHARAAARYE